MHEYLDLAVQTGYFDDPRVLYDLTPAEIAAVINGKSARERDQQRLENIRVGTLCATVVNLRRRKRSDRVFTWKDFFPDGSPKPAQSVEDMKRVCKEITLMFGGEVRQRDVA